VAAEHSIAGAAVTQAAAFDAVIEPLLHPGYNLAFAVLRDRTAAEDAVQEAAVQAWRSLRSLRDPARVRAWFLKIVLNQCRATMRTRWWRSSVLSDEVCRDVGAPDTSVELRVDMERALRRLTREQRAVLFLFYVMDLSQEEVARVLGTRLGTVKSRLHRAIERLREPMGAGGESPPTEPGRG
jgi:RNA polymerase sigma-70 factor (ECF subfamily)